MLLLPSKFGVKWIKDAQVMVFFLHVAKRRIRRWVRKYKEKNTTHFLKTSSWTDLAQILVCKVSHPEGVSTAKILFSCEHYQVTNSWKLHILLNQTRPEHGRPTFKRDRPGQETKTWPICSYICTRNESKKILFIWLIWDILGMSNYFMLALKCLLFNSLIVKNSIVYVN